MLSNSHLATESEPLALTASLNFGHRSIVGAITAKSCRYREAVRAALYQKMSVEDGDQRARD